MPEGKKFNLAFFLLLSFFLSFPLRMEDTFQWLRLEKINLNRFPSARMEVEALSFLKNDIWRFWPLYWTISDNFRERMEKKEPVRMRVMLKGGKLTISPVPLKVVSNFYWNEVMWYLSDTGKAWSEEHPINQEFYPYKENFPKIIIDDSMGTPLRGDEPVKIFTYPLASFLSYIRLVVDGPWLGDVQSLRFFKKGGVYQIAVSVIWNKKKFIVLLNKDLGVQNKIVAVTELLQKNLMLRSNSVFDATYKDKIIVSKIEI